MKCALGKESSLAYLFMNCPDMSSRVKHAKIIHESCKFGVKIPLDFIAKRNLISSYTHILQSLHFGCVAYIEFKVKSLSRLKIPER